MSNNKKLKNYFEKDIAEESILQSQNYNCQYKLNCPYIGFKSPVHVLRDNEILLEKVKQYESHMIFADNEIEKLKERIGNLQKENEILKGELNVNRKKIFKSGKKKDDLQENKKSSAGRKKGKKYNVKGNSRKRSQNFDEIIDIYPEECDCGNDNIEIYDSYDEHVIEDVKIVIKTTCYRRHQGYCSICQKIIYPENETIIPNIMIGENSRAIAGYLRYTAGVPYLKVKKIFKDLFNLDISPASLVNFDKKFTENGKEMYDTIQGMVKTSSYIHADETGWRVDGDNQWLWCFTNKELVYYKIDKARSSEVVKDVLGVLYMGILITDFFSAYGVIDATKKQKCLAHLLRFIKEIEENYVLTEKEKLFCDVIKTIFQSGIETYNKYHNNEITKKKLMQDKEKITKDLTDVIFMDDLENKKVINLQKRIIKYNDELFVFMENPEIEPTNNFAERQLRANVIMRKIMFGNRSPAGVRAHVVIMSITQTYMLHGYNPYDIFLLLARNKLTTIFNKKRAP